MGIQSLLNLFPDFKTICSLCCKPEETEKHWRQSVKTCFYVNPVSCGLIGLVVLEVSEYVLWGRFIVFFCGESFLSPTTVYISVL